MQLYRVLSQRNSLVRVLLGDGDILRRYGKNLLRVKGLMRAAGDPRPLVVQCVQGQAYPPVRLLNWPNEGEFMDGRGRLVFIARGLSEEQTQAIVTQGANLPGDRAALWASSADWALPTRCWLSQRVPVTSGRKIDHPSRFVQTVATD